MIYDPEACNYVSDASMQSAAAQFLPAEKESHLIDWHFSAPVRNLLREFRPNRLRPSNAVIIVITINEENILLRSSLGRKFASQISATQYSFHATRRSWCLNSALFQLWTAIVSSERKMTITKPIYSYNRRADCRTKQPKCRLLGR